MLEKIQFMTLMFIGDLKAKRDERGATAVEYGLMVALIAVAIIITVRALAWRSTDCSSRSWPLSEPGPQDRGRRPRTSVVPAPTHNDCLDGLAGRSTSAPQNRLTYFVRREPCSTASSACPRSSAGDWGGGGKQAVRQWSTP
ncbi:Flp family type IVb pilin [Nocardioides ungokensis]|uniref:Flp family type IVb pilin n=1 Tax=Nocardioides ungokensis TaxID=1643322 RepID=UPI001C610717|nr:Flp family type IVb pilin [Nocardioides ungokensis]